MAQNTANPVAVMRGLTAKFDLALSQVEPFYPQVATVVNSDGEDEEYARLGNMPGMREWDGDRLFHELRAETYPLKNVHYESSLEILRTKLEDDRAKVYGMPMQQLGIEAGNHPDETLFELLADSETAEGWDGQPFISDQHSFGESGVQSNMATYDKVQDMDEITATEFKRAFYAGRIAMLKIKNDWGKFLNRPTIRRMSSLLLLVPPELETVAAEAFTANIIQTDSNVVIDRPSVVATPYLTDPESFYVANVGGYIKPFIYQRRQPLKRQVKGMDDRQQKHVRFMCDYRAAVGFSPAWWTLVKVTLEEDAG